MRPLRHRPRAGTARASSEAGETLMEVLATVVLLGTGILAILGALLTSTTIARTNQELTTASLAAQKTGEELATPFSSSQNGSTGVITGVSNYIPCGEPAQYNPLTLPTDPTGADVGRTYSKYTAEVTKVDYLTGYDGNGTPQWDTTGPHDGTNCHLNAQADRVVSGMQRITIVIKRGNRTMDTVVVYKRNQLCPTDFSNADQGPC